MDFRSILELFRGLPFRQGVWLFPLATALPFLEEAPQFANWASKYALHYPPLFAYLSALAHRQGLLSTPLGLLAMAMAGVVHTLDVATSVFGVKLLSVANTRVSGRG